MTLNLLLRRSVINTPNKIQLTRQFATSNKVLASQFNAKSNDIKVDNKPTSSWPDGASSRPHTEQHNVEGREGKTARLIFRIKPSDIPTELIPLFAAVGFAVIGASAYGVYALYNDKTLRVHQQPERKS